MALGRYLMSGFATILAWSEHINFIIYMLGKMSRILGVRGWADENERMRYLRRAAKTFRNSRYRNIKFRENDMDFIKWDKSYSVGVRMIDAQHKKLFEMLNELHKIAKGIDGENAEPLENIILILAAYVDFHFRTEEEYFEKFDYEKTKEHMTQHKFYADKIREFKEKYKKGEKGLAGELIIFLEDWIKYHIKINDRKYAECFHKHGLY